MFKINETPTFTHPVKIQVPADEGHREDTIRVSFKALADDELAMFNTATLGGQKDLLRTVIVSLRDIVDEDDKEIEFSPALLEQLLGKSWARMALLQTYSRALVQTAKGN